MTHSASMEVTDMTYRETLSHDQLGIILEPGEEGWNIEDLQAAVRDRCNKRVGTTVCNANVGVDEGIDADRVAINCDANSCPLLS